MFEAIGAHAAGRITDDELTAIEEAASPGAGACGGQFTANTMAMAFQVLGISPISSGVPAEDPHKVEVAKEAGRLVMDVLDARPAAERHHHPRGPRERDRRGRVQRRLDQRRAASPGRGQGDGRSSWTIDDFDRISERTPLLCDLKPSGQYVAPDLYAAGGVPVVLKRLKEAGLLHEDAQTVTGKTVGQHADEAQETDGPARSSARSTTRSRPPAAW